VSLGDFLYQLQHQEAVSGPAPQRGILVASAAGLAAQVDADTIPISSEVAFIIKSLSIRATPGAAQTARTFIVQQLDGANNTLAELACANNNPAIAANINVGHSWHGEWILMPQERLRASVLFNAGAANNAVLFYVTGIYIPRGNLQLR